MEDFISLNVYFPKTHIPRLKSLQRGRVTGEVWQELLESSAFRCLQVKCPGVNLFIFLPVLPPFE